MIFPTHKAFQLRPVFLMVSGLHYLYFYYLLFSEHRYSTIVCKVHFAPFNYTRNNYSISKIKRNGLPT